MWVCNLLPCALVNPLLQAWSKSHHFSVSNFWLSNNNGHMSEQNANTCCSCTKFKIAERRYDSLSHYGFCRTPIPMTNATKAPDATGRGRRGLGRVNLGRFRKFVAREGVTREAERTFVDLCHLKHSQLRERLQKHTERIVLGEDDVNQTHSQFRQRSAVALVHVEPACLDCFFQHSRHWRIDSPLLPSFSGATISSMVRGAAIFSTTGRSEISTLCTSIRF